MFAFKCNMCNASLNIEEGTKIVTCEFCGSTQMIEKEYPGENLVKRGYMFLEEGNFVDAKEYFNKALDENVEASEAYLGKVLVENKTRKKEDFFNLDNYKKVEELLYNIKYSVNYKKAARFANKENKAKLEKFNGDLYRLTYDKAILCMDNGEYREAVELFKLICEYKDSEELLSQCEQLRDDTEREEKYNEAVAYMKKEAYKNAVNLLDDLGDYKDSIELIKECDYRRGESCMKSEDYMDAITWFKNITDYKDAGELLSICENIVFERRYQYAKEQLENSDNEKHVEEAREIFEEMPEYKDCEQLVATCHKELAYIRAKSEMKITLNINQFNVCEKKFKKLTDYKDSAQLAKKCRLISGLIKFVGIPLICIGFVVVILLVL